MRAIQGLFFLAVMAVLAGAGDAALAQEAASVAGVPPQPSMGMNVSMLVVIFVIIYFLLIRPQSKQFKKHKEMVESLQRGDVVITGGGIRGRVTKVEDNSRTVDVEIAPGVEVTVVRATIAEIEIRKNAPANDVVPPAPSGKKSKK